MQGIELTAQIAKSKYVPQNCNFFRFSSNINEYYNSADIIISHAGAGTIYNLLENNKKLIVVPNLDRSDKHQLEITKYLSGNNFAYCAYDFTDLKSILLKDIFTKSLTKYENKFNRLSNDIENYILNTL